MSGLIYLVAEGVHDVAFLGKLLSVCHGASRIKLLEQLDAERDALCRSWLASFKWPLPPGRRGTDIERLAVPAPVFYRLRDGGVVALRNAQGISNIVATIERDLESFERNQGRPETVAIVLDSDDEPADQRFQKLGEELRGLALAPPPRLGEVAAGPPRVGAFALPAPGRAGTLEDVLLALGEVAYPDLAVAARGYADDWRARADREPERADWKELRKPAGAKKAAIGAMTALLKPGKSTHASLEDNRWVCEETKAAPVLEPCIAFLGALLAGAAPASGSAS
jgi:hypothetical protein